MIVLPNMPGGYSVFCDDVRYEVGHKTSFIGVYNDSIYATYLPVTLPQLHVCVVLRDEAQSDRSITLKVILEDLEDGTETILKEDTEEFDPLSDEDGFSLASSGRYQERRVYFEISPFFVPSPSLLKVRGYIGKDEYRLGAIEIMADVETNSDNDIDG